MDHARYLDLRRTLPSDASYKKGIGCSSCISATSDRGGYVKFAQKMRPWHPQGCNPTIFDGRNILSHRKWQQREFTITV